MTVVEAKINQIIKNHENQTPGVIVDVHIEDTVQVQVQVLSHVQYLVMVN